MNAHLDSSSTSVSATTNINLALAHSHLLLKAYQNRDTKLQMLDIH